MSPSFTKLTIQFATIGSLVILTAGVAGAQKSKPAGPPPTTHGETKAAAPAAKGQATAEAKRTDAREDKADKKEEKSEAKDLREARAEPKDLLKGVKLSKTERKTVNDIQKKYDDQLKDLEKQEKAADKAGTPDATIAAKIETIRTQERADIRAALTPDQATIFDKNLAALGTKK